MTRHLALPVFAPLALIMFLAFPSLCFAAGQESARLPERFEARALWDGFMKDQAAMEERLLGKDIVVTGIVADTGMSRYMTPCVYLAGAEDEPALVICVLPRADAFKLSRYARGQRVTMSGRVYRFGQNGVVLKQSALYDDTAQSNPVPN